MFPPSFSSQRSGSSSLQWRPTKERHIHASCQIILVCLGLVKRCLLNNNNMKTGYRGPGLCYLGRCITGNLHLMKEGRRPLIVQLWCRAGGRPAPSRAANSYVAVSSARARIESAMEWRHSFATENLLPLYPIAVADCAKGPSVHFKSEAFLSLSRAFEPL